MLSNAQVKEKNTSDALLGEHPLDKTHLPTGKERMAADQYGT